MIQLFEKYSKIILNLFMMALQFHGNCLNDPRCVGIFFHLLIWPTTKVMLSH